MDLFKGSIPQDDQIMNLPLDTDRTRGDKPVRNPLELTGMTGPGPRRLLQREVSTVAKESRAQIVLTEPRRCQVTGIEVEGTVTDTRANIPFRCCDCGIRMATGHNSVTTEDKDKDPGPIRTYPVKTEYAPISGETVILRPMNLLEVPALRLPGVFLKLAEEARKSEVMDDQQSGMSAVKLHRSGQAGRVMITEITDSFPGLGGGASRVSQTSTEVIPDLNLVEPVIRLGPVGHLRNTEQPVILRVETNQGTISPPGPVGQHVLMAGHMEMMVQRDPVGPYEESEPSVSQGMISPPGPVGQHVLMAGHMEMMVQPDPVVPYEETEPSVSPGLDAGQVEQLPSSQVLPGVEMSHIQPVADGPAGLVRTRHPAGTVMPPVIQDGVRLLAGGPVGQFPDPRFHISSKDSSPDNSYQPLVMGPSGANMSDASYDTGPRLVGDPLDCSTSVDPMGPREMLSLGDGIPPASMGPVGRPLMTGQLMRQTKEPDWKWSTPTISESECDAELLRSVIRTEEEVYTGSVNTSVATGRMEPSEVLVLGDSVIFSPGAQIHRTEEGSESATVKPDPTIRTGGEGRTDDVNFDTNNGQSGSSVVSPSSDSGVHSLDEHWECMSTVSGNSDSIQSIITVYDGVVCEADSPPVRVRNVLTRGIVSSRGGTYGKHDSMSDLSSNGRNSDIAAMSDFSEDEAWEEVGPCGDAQPNIQTNCVGEDTIDSGEHSVLPATPTAVTHNVMEQHDEDYWTNFCLLAKQAFKLDDVKLAASSYPDAVKELVVRSRLKIENYPSTDDDSDSDSDSDTSYYECPLKVEYKDGWQYNTYTDGPDKTYYTNKAVGHDLTLEMEIEDKMDVCSEPDARATFELSPTKHVVALDNIGVNCIADGDVTVIRGNVDGDSDMHDDEFIRVSMISVDETRGDTSVNIHNSLGARECVIPECVAQPTLVAYGDSALCNKESLHIMRKYCFGLCGLTNQFHSTEFEWCVECVNRLIWGFLVSCVVSIVMRNRSVGTDVLSKGSDVIVSIWGLLDGLVILCDAMRECLWTLKDINDTLNNVMMGNRARMISHDIPWGEDNGQVRATRASVDISPIRVRGRFGCLGRPVQGADWLDVRPVDGGPVGTDIWIKYIGDSFSRYQSSDAAPLTEVQDIYITLHFNTECFAGLCSIRIVSFSVRITRSLEEVIRCGGVLSLCQTMDDAALADDQSGITFTADLCVPWDAPEAVVDMNSTDLISLGPFPDKVGLVGRRKDAAMSRIMKGRDCRSVRFVVPDVHLVDRGFHDVTVVDMGDDREPTIVLQDMTRLRELWPVEVFDQMKSRQQDLELMRKSAKRNYQQVRPMPCRFCGKVIRVDMCRHVARLHLDLVQLWRCPIAWCTTWKGSPQDCLKHVRSGHDAPWVEKTASIERYAPPWTVSRQLWNIHSSLGARECVIPECVAQPTLVAYGDSALCNKESLHIMRKYCFGLCGLTNQFHSTEFEWCVECVNRLIWGFLVSCVVSIVMRNRSVGTDVLSKGSDVIVSIWGLLDGLVILCDAMRECLWTLKDINDTLNNVMMGNRARMISHDIPWGEDNGQVRATRASVDISPIRVRGRFGCLGRPVQGADWLDVRPVDGGPVGTDIWIKYIGDSFSRYQSSDAAPLTEVQDIYITLHFNTECFAGLCSIRIVSFSVRITRSLEEVIRCGGVLSLCQTMDGAALADDRSGITFTADLCVPWDAPEAVVDMNSTDLVSLGPFPDKVGLVGRRKDAAMSRIMKGRDCRSVRFVVPDVHLVDRGFHDVAVVDMGDDREPTIVLQDMTRLRELWPVEVFDQMKSRQQDLELMRKSAKRNYQQVRPMPCRFCGKVIRVDMYRHVARLHLDLVQLWRCPIAWCTTWKGSPQDCLEHVRSGHDAPWVEKMASIERYAPRGRSHDSFGWIRCASNTPAYQPICCCLAKLGCH